AFGLLVQAIRRASRLAVTMEARGFGAGARTWARTSRFTAMDARVVLGGCALAALAAGLALGAGTWNLVWD
ncbi:MAG: energy-coupling factor transporter transrane protein EcfT, partial [Citricoccus sp.]|nr:energy-coupling factor transporter transrane protein EcfT [Citricoccus sp. WCRC_4]